MKILILNGSPKRDASDTMCMTHAFIEGMNEVGENAIHTVHVIEQNIQYCTGCFSCMKNGGMCIYDDDMRGLLEEMLNADLLIFSFPLYCYGMPAPLKALIDRTLPLSSMQMKKVGERYEHIAQADFSNLKYLMICGCGFPNSKECECMKKLIALLLALVCVLGLVGCNTKSMDYIIENKPSVTGIVEEVHDDYIIMYSETAEGYPNGTNWSISLNVENKDSYTDIVVGDEIVVYYDGMAAETDPLQVGTVYAITLKTPADRTENAKTATIMVNGTNYYSTDNAVPVEVDESVIQYTTSYVENGIPQKDGEANFNKDLGTPYAVIEGDRVVVLMDNEWIEFKAK